MIVKGWKATREQLGHCSTLGERKELVSVSVFQHENFLYLRRFRGGETSFSVPRSPVHPKLTRLLPQDDPVVTQNMRRSKGPPKACCRALSGTRVAQKEMA